MAAVCDGKPIDTTMSFTPASGLVMGTRPGDLDPRLLFCLMDEQNASPHEMEPFISQRCGLLGVSGNVTCAIAAPTDGIGDGVAANRQLVQLRQ